EPGSVLDPGPGGLKVELRLHARRMASAAHLSHRSDPAVTLGRVFHVIGARTMALFALHALQESWLKGPASSGLLAGRVAGEAARFELDPTNRQLVRSMSVTTGGPLNVSRLVASGACGRRHIGGRRFARRLHAARAFQPGL